MYSDKNSLHPLMFLMKNLMAVYYLSNVEFESHLFGLKRARNTSVLCRNKVIFFNFLVGLPFVTENKVISSICFNGDYY